jgi:hypothetical protein
MTFASGRFFLNLVSDAEIIRDVEGLILSSQDDLASNIERAVTELAQEGDLGPEDLEGWRMLVTDAMGRPVWSVTLGDPSQSRQPTRLN